MREITIAVLLVGFLGGAWSAIYLSNGFKDVVLNFVQGFIIGMGLALAAVVVCCVFLLLLIGLTEIFT